MASYDPKRTRPASGPHPDEPAPVDLLLGPPGAAPDTPLSAPSSVPRPVTLPDDVPAPSGPGMRLAVVAGVAAAAAVAYVLLRRRRS